MQISIKRLAMEGQLDGKEKEELELVIIARLDDLSKLKALNLDIEAQEQYTIKKPNGEVRVRKADEEYELTTKWWEPGVVGKKEAESACSEDQFICFKKICDNGMIKDRYHYPLYQFKGAWNKLRPDAPYEGSLVLEIDVFKDLEGSERPYVKIDLEYPRGFPMDSEKMLGLLPDVGFTELIHKQWNERTEEEARQVAMIYNEHFTVKP